MKLATSSEIILGAIVIYIIAVSLITVTLFGIQNRNKKKLNAEFSRLETLKNLIISSGILTEMEKVKALINNEKLEKKYNKWEKRYHKIEEESLPSLTDKLLEAEGLIEENKFKEASYVLARAELEIYYVKTDSELLLEEVKEITQSEERNRNAVTKLKALYREVVSKYNDNRKDYSGMETNIDLQFENINKLLSAFEVVMEKNDYDEVGKVVHALDDLIKNIKIVIDETPTVILLGKMVIPKKILDLKTMATKMKKDGYNIEYMALDKNIEEAEKKIKDIFDRLKMLNLEDSIFELKTMLDYFESLYLDFDKEKQSKKEYDKYINSLGGRISRLTQVIKNIYEEVAELKEAYQLSEDELNSLDGVNREIVALKEKFKVVSDRTLIRSTPYSRLSKDFELISVKITKVEDKLEGMIKSLGSLKEDEIRAREQLIEIRNILKEAKNKIKNYKLPIVPKEYFVELKEAKEGLSLVSIELERKPIVIDELNTRVDTGRDLVLKLYNLSNELTKTAAMAEMSIVYGNRYRSEYKEVEEGLNKAEIEFRKGEYRKSLETAINILNQVEPGIHKKLLSAYEN